MLVIALPLHFYPESIFSTHRYYTAKTLLWQV